jgi:hypothetical protein
MKAHTPGPWKLIWYGTERYPYPLSIHTEDDANWIARDGTVARPEDAQLMTAAPSLLEALQAIARQACVQPDRDPMQAYSDIELIRELAESAITKATTNKAENG